MTSLARLGLLVSNISWSSSGQKHHQIRHPNPSPPPNPRPRNHPSTPNRTEPPASDWQWSTYRNNLRCVRNDELRLVCCKRSIPCPENCQEASELVATWLPFSIYHFWECTWLMFLKLQRMRRCEKRTFYRLARSEQMSGSELQKKSVPKMGKKSQIQKKSSRCFSGQRSSWKSSNLLWTVHPPVLIPWSWGV